MNTLSYLNANVALLVTCCFLLGLIVGSFLNVVIYRLPIMMERRWRIEAASLVEDNDNGAPNTQTGEAIEEEPETFNLLKPDSRCSACNTPIKPWHNLPVISYLLLGGKCAQCKTPYSARYPAVEALTGVLSAAVAYVFFGDLAAVAAALLLTWSLVALTGIDYDTYLLPDNITLPLLWAGLIVNYYGTFTAFENAFWGAVAGYLLLWAVFWLFKLLTGKEGMGYGDFKLLAALGAWLGWQLLPVVVVISSMVGAVVGISLILFAGREHGRPIPFGPYLAAAGWIALLWGDAINTWYVSFAGLA